MTLLAVSGPLVLVQLALVLGVLLGGLTWLGRRARAHEPGVVQPIRLGAHHALHIVTVEDRRLLVGTGPGAAPQLICDLGDRPRGERSTDASRPVNGHHGPHGQHAAGGLGMSARPRGGWDQDA